MFQLKRVNKAIQHTLLISMLGGAACTSTLVWAKDPNIVQSYDIPSGALDQVLIRFAAQSGITLAFDQASIGQLSSHGLQGNYSIASGLKKLLASHPYQIQSTPTGYTLIYKSVAQVKNMGELNTINYGVSNKNQPAALDQQQVANQLPLITVTAAKEGYTANQVNTKLGSSIKEIPQSISVMTRQQLDDLNATTLEDVMQYATGISAYGNTDGADNFYARNGLVNFSFNGVPSTANNQFDMAVYDQIEVLRGPSGLLNGSGNPTGTINLVRKRALGEFEAKVATSIGSWQNYRTEVDVTNALNQDKTIRGRAIIAAEDRKYFYDHADSDKVLGSGTLEFDLSPDTVFGISGTIQQANLTPFSGFPGDDQGNLLGLRRSTNLDAKYNTAKRDTWEIMSDLTHQFNENWKTQATIRYYEGEYTGVSGNPRVAVNTTTQKMGFAQARSESEQKNLSADLNLKGDFDLLNQKQEVLLGLNYDRQLSESGAAILPRIFSANWFNPGYANVWDIPDITEKSQTKVTQSGIYGMLRLKPISQLSVILGSRLSNYTSKNRDSYPNLTAWTQDQKETSEFTPYGGLVFDITKNINWYASYADVFIPQSTRDYKLQVLKPKVGWQVETGFKGAFFDDRLNASLAVFRIREENSPIADPDTTHQCFDTSTGADETCQVAGGLVKTEGVEAEISGELVTGLQVAAGYTHSEKTPLVGSAGKGKAGAVNVSTTSAPKDVFKLWANYKFQPNVMDGKLDGLSIGGGIYAIGKTYGWSWSDYDLKQGGYSVVSLQGAYQFDQNLSASLTVNNVFDKTYYRQLNDERSYNNYGDPRNVMLKLVAKY